MKYPARSCAAEATAVRNGEARAADDLFQWVYDELRRLAQSYVAAEPHSTLSATDLVHEAYLKLLPGGDWSDRAHFMAVAARAMRQILVDRARARGAAKRGGDARVVTLNPTLARIFFTPDIYSPGYVRSPGCEQLEGSGCRGFWGCVRRADSRPGHRRAFRGRQW